MQEIFKRLKAAGGKPFFVGGFVRDKLLNVDSKDVDLEVFGLQMEQLLAVLSEFGEPVLNGSHFKVAKLKFGELDLDFALPRKEVKIAPGHKGFNVTEDPFLHPEIASLRRDFTVNALMQDVETNEVFDYHGGVKDLEDKVLQAVSPAFVEDPVRVLRAMQFAARFDMTIDDATAKMCFDLLDEFDTVSRERIWVEWHKFFLKSVKPSKGFEVLKKTGWISKFPELANIDGLHQDRIWHPEGDVLTHTGLVMDYMVKIADREQLSEDDRVALMMSALLHDVGKHNTTEVQPNGRITSRGHEGVSADMVDGFLESIDAPQRFNNRVRPLVKYHMARSNKVTSKGVRRMARKIAPASMQQLCWLMEADKSGRPPLPEGPDENIQKMMAVSLENNVVKKPVERIVTGKDLIELGLSPSPEFSRLLSECERAQDRGDFLEKLGGVEFLKTLL